MAAMTTTRKDSDRPRSVLVLGSTGSVGTQALEVIAVRPERFTVAGLAAGGADVTLLAAQARAHRVRRIAVADPAAARELGRMLPGVEVLACVAAGPRRWPGWCSPRRAVPSAVGGAPSWPTSHRRRRSPTRPGPWDR
jgi:pimeloyl-ACP methyl ester carboxylesterase